MAIKYGVAFRLDREQQQQALAVLRQVQQEMDAAAAGTHTTSGIAVPPAATPATAAAAEPAQPPRLVPGPTCRLVAQTDAKWHENKTVPSLSLLTTGQGLDNALGWVASAGESKINVWRCADDSGALVMQYQHKLSAEVMTTAVLGNGAGPLLVSTKDQIRVLQLAASASGSCMLSSVASKQVPIVNQIAALEGGTLPAGSFACAVKGYVVVFQLGREPPVHSVNAHTAPITVFRQSRASADLLFSGDAKGVVKLWDARSMTPAVSLEGKHSKPVTCIESSDAVGVLSGAADGRLLQWDLRNLNEPVQSLTIDGKPILNLRFDATLAHAAVSTLKGVYTLTGSDLRPVAVVLPEDQRNVKLLCPDVAWNPLLPKSRAVFYASDVGGIVRTFSS